MYSASVTVSNYAPHLISFVKLISILLIGFGVFRLIHAICWLVFDENSNGKGNE